MTITISTSAIPHRYRNRFLRDSNGNISLNGGTSITPSGGGGGGNEFEPHYLWGQYFDDTQDISGDLTGVGNIDASGLIKASSISATTISGSTGRFTNGITAKTGNFTTRITSPEARLSGISANTIVVNNKLSTNQLEAVSGWIQTLLSEEITVDYLTVTKAAHFFKLIIDEIKATQGQIIITPANAVIDKVETVNGNYRCYFKSKDGEREIYNTFEINDQVICQTFNAATGVSYNVSNTYYWRLCVGTGSTSTTINGETVDCHYIDLSDSDKETYSFSVPQAGDNCVQLGNRTDTTRQAAIIISAYENQYLDTAIKAPSIVQYYGINDYNLSNHRRNIISRDLNEFRGTFKTTSGDDIEELIDDVTSGITAYLHTAWANSSDGSVDFTKNPSGGHYSYVGFCSNNTQSDESLIYSDYNWAYIKGSDGTNGVNGDDGISVSSVTEWYLISSLSANVTTATTGWQTSFISPTEEKKYLWNYEENNYSDGTSQKTTPVIIGNYSKDGDNGRGISAITEYYKVYTASTGVYNTDLDWSTTVPTMTAVKKYLWNYELVTYSDNTTAKTEAVVIGVYGDKGESGASVTVTATSITYAVTTSSTQPSDSEFIYTSIPTLSKGDFLWCKSIIEYSDGTVTKSYSVSRIGADGEDGTNGTNGTNGVDSYLHIAYALSSDGSSGFSLTYFNGALYIGTCTNSTSADPQSYTAYTWARLKGEKGEDGDSIYIVSTSVTYAVTNTSTQPNDSQFIYTSIPTVSKGQYLWTKTIVTYSDGTSTKTYTVSYKGTDGDKGDAGDDAEFYRLVPIVEKAIVDINGTLGVSFQYQIAHVSGSSVTVATASTSNYWVRVKPNNTSTFYNLSVNTVQPSYTNASFITNYHKQVSRPTYFTVYLVYGSEADVVDQKTVSVIFDAAATLEVTDQITATVQGYSDAIDELSGTVSSHTNSIATLNLQYSALTTTVESNTTNIENLSGTVTSNTYNISQLQQTSQYIRSTVEQIDGKLPHKNYFAFNRGIKPYNNTCYLYPYGYGFVGFGSLDRIYNFGFTDDDQDETWTLLFYIKAEQDVTVYPQFCDYSPDYIYRYNTSQQNTTAFTATTSWVPYRCVWEDFSSSYLTDGTYNGFLDFEKSNSSTIIYLKNICLVKGHYSELQFNKAEEDLNYQGGLQPFTWSYNNVTQDGTYRGLTVYKNTVKPSSTNTFIDYITHENFTIKDKTPYTLSFWAKADRKDVKIYSYFYNSDWNLHIKKGGLENDFEDGLWEQYLTTEWKRYTVHWYPHTETLNGVASQQFIKHIIALRLANESGTANSAATVSICGVVFQEGWIEDGVGSSSSMIEQTANSIQLSVYDNLRNRTGIDVENGSITLDADNTTIVGNLNITDTQYGLTEYDSNGIARVFIQPDSINQYEQLLSQGTWQIYSHTNNSTGHTSLSTSFTQSLGSFEANKMISVSNFSIMTNYNRNNTLYSLYNVSMQAKILKDGVEVAAITVPLALDTSYPNSYTYKGLEAILNYTVKESGSFTVQINVGASTSIYTTDTLNCTVSYKVQTGYKVMSYFGNNGFFVHNAPNSYLYANEQKLEIRNEFSGLRLIRNKSDNNASLETVVGRKGTLPNQKPVWMSLYNYVPMFSVGSVPRIYQYQNISNISASRWAYAIDAYKDAGICYVGTCARDASDNKQETWIILPSPLFTDRDGDYVQLPMGYKITIINDLIGSEAGSVFVVPSSGYIIDGNRDQNSYCQLNGSQSSDTYIYVGYFNGSHYWRAMHDTQ